MILAALFELTLFAAFFWIFIVALLVGVAFDRHGYESPKWYLIGVGFIALAAYFWNDFTFIGNAVVPAVVEAGKVVTPEQTRVVLWDAVTGWSFWSPILAFLGIGIVYSGFEFALAVRRSARAAGRAWEKFIAKTKTVPVFIDNGDKPEMTEAANGARVPKTVELPYSEMISQSKHIGGGYHYYHVATDLVRSFAGSAERYIDGSDADLLGRRTSIIKLDVTDHLTVVPRVDKVELAEHVGAWTMLWPFYAISLIIGDLLQEVFIAVADFLASISGRAVRFAFRDTFKLS